MKKLLILLHSFMIVCSTGQIGAIDLRGKFGLSGKGGLTYSAGGGFLSEDKIENNYGFGISVEYFPLKPLSLGLSLVHNSFQDEWRRSSYYQWWNYYYSTDWNWTNVSIFTKFVLGPENMISPYLTSGVGLYIPRIKDWIYRHPDTLYTHKSYGKGQFGWHFGMGIQYLLTKRMLAYFETPLNLIYTEGLVIRGVDSPVKIGPSHKIIEQYHKIYDKSQYFNIFAGVSFLFGTGKEVK